MKSMSKWSALVLALVIPAIVAQTPTFKRTIVQRADISVPGREAVVVHIEFEPGAHAGRHSHPGEEIGYVIEGEGELTIDGQPARAVKAGDGFIIPTGALHDMRNTGAGVLKLSGVYIVEKGKPMATMAP
jgi:quercetin dioxygenase-like cupin family protein